MINKIKNKIFRLQSLLFLAVIVTILGVGFFFIKIFFNKISKPEKTYLFQGVKTAHAQNCWTFGDGGGDGDCGGGECGGSCGGDCSGDCCSGACGCSGGNSSCGCASSSSM